MGGALEASSTLDEGSCFGFTVELPTAPPEEQVRLSDHFTISIPPGALRQFWALLVDDTPTNLFLMETVCQSIGLPYRTARNTTNFLLLATTSLFPKIRSSFTWYPRCLFPTT